jgi:hypothetical protein
MVPSGSWEFEPFKVTVTPALTVCVGPASATGGRFVGIPGFTVTIQLEVPVNPLASVTVSVNVKAVLAATLGAVKVAFAELPLSRVTSGVPAVWLHA